MQQLQDELRAAQKKIRAIQAEKDEIATRLDDTLRQLDKTKVSAAEMKAQLKQAQDTYQNVIADKSQAAGSQKEAQERLNELQNALEDAEADRDAADEQGAALARRASKARVTAQSEAEAVKTANAHTKEIEAKYADAGKVAAQLDAAKKQIAGLTKDRDAATAHATELTEKFAKASKTAAELLAAQQMVATFQKDQGGERQSGGGIRRQTGGCAQADGGHRQGSRCRGGAGLDLEYQAGHAQKEIATVKTERDKVASQRDQALADLDKARAAGKKVDQLVADNATLMQKLTADEKTIHDFKSNSPEKDKQILALRKEVSDTKPQLTNAQKERDDVQSTLNDLQKQFDRTSTELTDLKTSGVSAEDKKKLTDENDLLRGIVLRQLKEQARRNEAKKLVMAELPRCRCNPTPCCSRSITWASQSRN